MDTINYKTLSREELKRFVSDLSPDRLYHELFLMSADQIEVAASVLTFEQLLGIQMVLEEKTQLTRLLPALLVGIPHELFMHFLSAMPPPVFSLMKREGSSEAMQHQVNLIIHSLTDQAFKQEADAEKVNRAIDALDPFHIDTKEMDLLVKQLDKIVITARNMLDGIRRPIELAWNTDRPDLVDKLSYLKEHTLHLLVDYIGVPRSAGSPPTGLYALIETRLDGVYNTGDKQYDIDMLVDHEPAIEGLTKLGIWYLKDYWQLGLLPSISYPQQLELDMQNSSEKQRLDHKEQLMALVRGNLKKICLFTIGDLKRAHIYSRAMLEKYISDNRYLL